MAGLNKVMLIGNLGADPEVRNTQGGQQVAKIRLATTEKWKDRDGQRQERTEWHNVVLWGPLAEIVERYARKGSRIYVEGKLATSKWVDKSGVERLTTEVVVQGFGGVVQLLDAREGDKRPARNDDEREARPKNIAAGKGGYRKEAPAAAGGFDDDDIPF
jgi:single-strand DNA-binding protein